MDYLELTTYKKLEKVLHLYLKEISLIPKKHRQNKLSSRELFDEITPKDFHIRGH